MKQEISFYCIKLIRQDGTRGWLIDRPEGIQICIGGIVSDVTQFETEKDALKFIRERKLERRGVKAYVRNNLEMIEEFSKVETKGVKMMFYKPVFHIENQKGEKLWYDSKEEGYYFKSGEHGYPCWETEDQVRNFVRVMDLRQLGIIMVKHEKGKKENKLIQVYGRRKQPDGTMGPPEYIEIKDGENFTL